MRNFEVVYNRERLHSKKLFVVSGLRNTAKIRLKFCSEKCEHIATSNVSDRPEGDRQQLQSMAG